MTGDRVRGVAGAAWRPSNSPEFEDEGDQRVIVGIDDTVCVRVLVDLLGVACRQEGASNPIAREIGSALLGGDTSGREQRYERLEGTWKEHVCGSLNGDRNGVTTNAPTGSARSSL